MSSAKQHRKYDSGYQKRRKKQRIDDMLEKIDYERIIEDFVSKNAQKIKFFK